MFKNNLKRMMLEADTGANGGSDTSTTETNETASETSTEAIKTFTQEDIDKAVNRVVARERKNQIPKEELEAFKQWKESQKTEEEKRNEAITNAELKVKEAEERANNLEAKVTCLSKGVQATSVDDVVVLAKSMVNDDTTIEEAIDKVLEKYPSFKGTQQVQEDNKGFRVGADSQKQNETTNDALARAFGNK